MTLRALYIFIAVAGFLVVASFAMVVTRIKTTTDTDKITFPSIDDVPKEYWAKLADKKIFFGHQSVKAIISKPGFLEDNLMRQSYNELLRNAYAGTAAFFDVARTESVNDGHYRCYVSKGARKVFVMAPEYTEDGGHLNSLGLKKAAEQLLITLAEIAGRS